MKLPDEIPTTPYEALAFRVHHYHNDEDDPDPGTIVLELAARLPGTEAELSIPFELNTGTVVSLIDELLHQYRCLVYGLPEDEEEDDDTSD